MSLLMVTADWPPIEGGISRVATGLAGGLSRLGQRLLVVAPRLAGYREAALRAGVEVAGSPLYAAGGLRLLPLAAVCGYCSMALRPRLLVAMNPTYGGLIGRGLGIVAGLPYVVYAYGYDFMKYARRPVAARALRSLYRSALRVVAISQFARERLIAFGVPADRIVVIPPGIEALSSSTAPPPPVRTLYGLAGDPFVLTVARLIPRKGLTCLGRAMVRVLARRSDLRWVVVGRGPERRPLEHLLRAAELTARTHLLGRVPDDHLNALYGEAQLFALTPLELPGDAEGFGLVFVEAGLHGLAAVASATGGVPEAVVDDRTGLLVPPDDVERTEEALLSLVDAPELAARLGSEAQARAGRMSWTAHARALLELL